MREVQLSTDKLYTGEFMRKFITIVVLALVPQFVLADFVITRCDKWSTEGWSNFVCSNEKAYVVGKAVCSTTDSRRNGAKNTSHGPKDVEIFCRFKLRDDVDKCNNDGGAEVESCYEEYQVKAAKSSPSQKANPAATR